MNSAGGLGALEISVPQLEMQPTCPLDLGGVQYSGVMPHWPQVLH